MSVSSSVSARWDSTSYRTTTDFNSSRQVVWYFTGLSSALPHRRSLIQIIEKREMASALKKKRTVKSPIWQLCFCQWLCLWFLRPHRTPATIEPLLWQLAQEMAIETSAVLVVWLSLGVSTVTKMRVVLKGRVLRSEKIDFWSFSNFTISTCLRLMELYWVLQWIGYFRFALNLCVSRTFLGRMRWGDAGCECGYLTYPMWMSCCSTGHFSCFSAMDLCGSQDTSDLCFFFKKKYCEIKK